MISELECRPSNLLLEGEADEGVLKKLTCRGHLLYEGTIDFERWRSC